jgi:hypothetical protein
VDTTVTITMAIDVEVMAMLDKLSDGERLAAAARWEKHFVGEVRRACGEASPCPDCGEPVPQSPCGSVDCELDRRARETLERFGADYAAARRSCAPWGHLGWGALGGTAEVSEDVKAVGALLHAVGRLFRPVPRPAAEETDGP